MLSKQQAGLVGVDNFEVKGKGIKWKKMSYTCQEMLKAVFRKTFLIRVYESIIHYFITYIIKDVGQNLKIQ